jgi:hypothetical protein
MPSDTDIDRVIKEERHPVQPLRFLSSIPAEQIYRLK